MLCEGADGEKGGAEGPSSPSSLSPLFQWSPFLGAKAFRLSGGFSNPRGKDLINTLINTFTLIGS